MLHQNLEQRKGTAPVVCLFDDLKIESYVLFNVYKLVALIRKKSGKRFSLQKRIWYGEKRFYAGKTNSVLFYAIQ